MPREMLTALHVAPWPPTLTLSRCRLVHRPTIHVLESVRTLLYRPTIHLSESIRDVHLRRRRLPPAGRPRPLRSLRLPRPPRLPRPLPLQPRHS
jgi:hypothetical protein